MENSYFNVLQFKWRIVYNIYVRFSDNLPLTCEWHVMILLDSRLILKIVVSPENGSALRFERCVICFMCSDDGKSSNTYW